MRAATTDKKLREDYKTCRNISAAFALREAPEDIEKGHIAYTAFRRTQRRGALKHILHNTAHYAAIVLLAAGVTWGIFTHQGNKQSANASYSVSAPWGQRAKVRLSDGTQVWLNSGSMLSCAEGFTTQRREVVISGEAFFDVAHDAQRPFIVSTDSLKIKVLGTRFNVSAYKSSATTISLVEGAVEITAQKGDDLRMNMLPNDQVCYTDRQLHVTHTFDHDMLLWRDGIHVFKNATLGQITERLEFYYHTHIVIRNPKIHDIRYSGKFRQEEGVYEILRLLQQVHGFQIIKDDATGVICIE